MRAGLPRLAWGRAGQRSFWGLPHAVGTAGNGALPGGALFLGRNRGKNTKGKEVPSPWNPILWWEKRGKVVPSGRGLACGLQDQRLMARPPARAGGRSGLLTGGEREKPKRPLSAFFQRVPICVPSPPSRWAGRYGPFAVRAAGRVSRKKYSLPPTQPHQRRESRGKNLFPLGFFPPFLPKKWGPGRAGPVPCRSNGAGRPPQAPRPGASRSRPFRQCRDKPPQTAKQRASPSGSPLSHSVMESPLRRWPGISPAGPVPP